jgi:hypothetical protein
MELKMGDAIYVKGFKDEKPEFYCWKHMKDLIGYPTKVFLVRNGDVFVTHPILDVVPLSKDCVDYEVIEGVDLGYHRDLKKNQIIAKKMGMEKIPQKHIGKIFRNDNLNEEESKPNMEKRLVDIIRRLEDGGDDDSLTIDMVEKFFGSIQNFINILDKKELIQHLNPLNVVWDDYQNYLLYKKVDSDRSYIWNVINSLSDIEKIGDTYYFNTNGEEISNFFKSGRNDISQETIREIISGEYNINTWDFTNDEHNDIYKELTIKNQKLVDDRIREELIQMGTIDAHTDELEIISNEQGRDDVELTDDVITRILNDEETMKWLINQVLDDVRSDLYSTYSGCYESTLTDSWYGDIMSELVGEVIDNTTFEEYKYTKTIYNKAGQQEKRTMYGRSYPVTDCVFSLVKDWIYEYKDSTWNDDSINYHGSYYNLMKAAMDSGLRSELNSPRLDDYADDSQVSRCVNEHIGDYF